MTVSEIAPYIAIVVTVTVWVLTQRANRKHEIFKERLKRRVEMFDGFLPAIGAWIEAITKYNEDTSSAATQACQNAFKILCGYRIKLLCYGMSEEISAYEDLIDTIDNQKMKNYAEKNNKFVDLIKRNLRTELDID